MRIIAGEFRGRKLLPPLGNQTRPITDRAKQSLFDILAPFIENCVVYDCFAGTGSLGLESLSRRARRATFFESHRDAVGFLEKNLASLKISDRARIVRSDIFAWFDQSPDADERADLVFLDPPYRYLVEQPEKLKSLAKNLSQKHLKPGAIVVFRHDAADALDLPHLLRYDVREYGGMTLEFLRYADPSI